MQKEVTREVLLMSSRSLSRDVPTGGWQGDRGRTDECWARSLGYIIHRAIGCKTLPTTVSGRKKGEDSDEEGQQQGGIEPRST
ncbi:hypothetical protein KM043_014302 [Ampulex compressa]|nr:hypothetical protein KM043_014302 [Ampulex compressa]